MAHADYLDNQNIVVDLVDNAVIAHAYPIGEFGTFQFSDTYGIRILCQSFNTLQHLRDGDTWKLFQLFQSGTLPPNRVGPRFLTLPIPVGE